MKKVLTAIVTFIFSVCLITATVATASAASVKKVTNFKASATPIAVTLTWNKASGAKGYEIQQKSGKKWKAVATIKKQKTTTYTVKKLKNGTTYQFRIRAVNGKKKSAYVTVKVKTGVQKIANVKATSTGLKSVKLTWDKANVTGYEIQRKDGKKWKTVKKIKKAKTVSLTVSKLPAAAKSTFRIRGYVNGSAKTYYGSYTTVSATTAVTPMKNVSVKSVTDTSATIGWAKLSGVSGYQVQQLKSGKWVDLNKAVKSSVTQYTVKNLPAFTNQQFRVRAYQKDGKKTYYNNWVTVNAKTKLGNVTGVTYSGHSANNPKYVKISWKAAGGAAGYRVMNGKTKLADVKTTYAELKALNPATAYKITVVPYNGSTVGNTSSAVSFTTYCAQVTGVKATGVTDSTVSLSWNKIFGASSYRIQYSKDGGKSWLTVTTSTNNATLINLSSNTEYQIKVCAVNKNGSATQFGKASTIIKETTSGCSTIVDVNSVSLIWKEVPNAKDYIVEYYLVGSDDWMELAVVSETKYVCENDEGLGLYRIKARNDSNKVVYTSDGITIAKNGYTLIKDDYKVSFSWPKTANATGYKIIKSSQNNLQYVEILDADVNTYSTVLAPELIHEFSIYAYVDGKSIKLEQFGVQAAKINLNDKTDSGITSKLVYLAEAINRSKYDYSQKTTVNTQSTSSNRMTHMEFAILNAGDTWDIPLKLALNSAFKGLTSGVDYVIDNGSVKCYNEKAVNALLSFIDDGSSNTNNLTETIISEGIYNETFNGSGTITIENNGKKETKTSFLYNSIQPKGLGKYAYIYNSENASAWKNGFESVTMKKISEGYEIIAVLKKERADSSTNKKAEYHAGLVDAIGNDDINFGEDTGTAKTITDTGKTTITAKIDNNCRLLNYNVKTSYVMDMDTIIKIPLSEEKGGASLDFKMATSVMGSESTAIKFTRNK